MIDMTRVILEAAAVQPSKTEDALRGISRAKRGSVRRLVEAARLAKGAIDGTITDEVEPNAPIGLALNHLAAALAEIEVEQENAK